MANKLKDLSVTSVDLVDQGANPDAHICLFKRGNGNTEDTDTEVMKSMTIDRSQMTPDAAKTLAEFQELTKRQSAEVEELKKSLEIERLTAAARKYEVLGKKAPELAAKLYDLKKAGGTVYEDYVALLDENLSVLTKSGLFGEIGSNRQGNADTMQTLHIKAQELKKAATEEMTTSDAIIKAWEENPELAAQYEAEYRGS